MEDHDAVYDLLIYGYAGGLIQTPQLALAIAKTLVCDYCDEIEWEAVQPLDVRLERDIWHICTRKELRKPRHLIMEIAKRDGQIRKFQMPATIGASERSNLRLSEAWKNEEQRKER